MLGVISNSSLFLLFSISYLKVPGIDALFCIAERDKPTFSCVISVEFDSFVNPKLSVDAFSSFSLEISLSTSERRLIKSRFTPPHG